MQQNKYSEVHEKNKKQKLLNRKAVAFELKRENALRCEIGGKWIIGDVYFSSIQFYSYSIISKQTLSQGI